MAPFPTAHTSHQKTDPSLINPPYCAWRFVGNHDAWNVAFPDMRSMYHVMQMNMGTSVRPSVRARIIVQVCVCRRWPLGSFVHVYKRWLMIGMFNVFFFKYLCPCMQTPGTSSRSWRSPSPTRATCPTRSVGPSATVIRVNYLLHIHMSMRAFTSPPPSSSQPPLPTNQKQMRQTYELRRLMSQKSLRDVDIVPENGPNCYANLTAAVNGEKQGRYRHVRAWLLCGSSLQAVHRPIHPFILSPTNQPNTPMHPHQQAGTPCTSRATGTRTTPTSYARCRRALSRATSTSSSASTSR